MHYTLSLNYIPFYIIIIRAHKYSTFDFLVGLKLGSDIFCQHRLTGQVLFPNSKNSRIIVQDSVQPPLESTPSNIISYEEAVLSSSCEFHVTLQVATCRLTIPFHLLPGESGHGESWVSGEFEQTPVLVRMDQKKTCWVLVAMTTT